MSISDHADAVDRLVAQANAAARNGGALRVLDEIRAMPLDPDPRLDQALVMLRHAAFGELPQEPGRPRWPDEFADPFPEEQDIPSARPAELTGDLIGGALTNHGCLRVDGLIPVAEALEVAARIDQVFDARDRARVEDASDGDAPWYQPFEPGQEKAQGFGADGFVRTVDSPRMMRVVAEIFDRTGVREAVAGYLGERPVMIANKWILRRSPTGKAGTDYHQDGAFLGEGIRTVDCWVALSHCGPGTGRPAIDLVPRRFDRILDSPDSAFPWSLTEQDLHAADPDAPVVSPVFAPGDALFFDELLPHRTTVGLDLAERHALESWFVAPSSYPGKHTPVVI